MSLLSTPTARPERVFSLISLVRTLGGRVKQTDAKEWLAPSYRNAQGGAPKDGDRVREVFRVARDLGLLESEGNDWVNICELPSTRRLFALHVHKHLCGLPNEDPDAVLLRAYAWCVAFVEAFGTAELVDRGSQTIANEISEALGRSGEADDEKVFNPTKLAAWKDWMAFLGLGWNDLPGTNGFLPDPSRRIAEELAGLVGSQSRVEGQVFIAAISRSLPYLDGGALFGEACNTRGLHPAQGQISKLLSQALRMLDGDGVLKFDVVGDTKKGVSLSKDLLSKHGFFSHLEFPLGTNHV
jgi:hypothetical protein